VLGVCVKSVSLTIFRRTCYVITAETGERGYCVRACAVDSRPGLLARRPVEGSVTK
jgi:hypothetical protein